MIVVRGRVGRGAPSFCHFGNTRGKKGKGVSRVLGGVACRAGFECCFP